MTTFKNDHGFAAARLVDRADPAPLWTVLDCTPEGRGKDWYPQLDYGPRQIQRSRA